MFDSQTIRRHPEFDEHKKIVFISDKRSGLRGIIAVHRTFFNADLLRPTSLGGVRMRPYKNEYETLTDVLRLSARRGMSGKAALAGVDFGGAKAVIIGDPKTQKTNELLLAFASAVGKLEGMYVCAEDMGIKVPDIDYIRGLTRWAVGGSLGFHGSGEPGRATAKGVFEGIKVCVKRVFGTDSVRGMTDIIQGIGSVGFNLAVLLIEAGAHAVITDTNVVTLRHAVRKLEEKIGNLESRHESPGTFTVVNHHASWTHEAHIFSPCATGAIINDGTIDGFKCPIIAGAANNQLHEPRHGDMLHKKGILYAPDYVINAGGLINVADETKPGGYNERRAFERILGIPKTLEEIFMRSEQEGLAPHRIADAMALKIINERSV